MRILIVRLSAIGDVANAMPAVAGLRDALPSAHIAWIVEDRARGLVECNRDVDEVIEFPRRRWDRFLASPTHWTKLLGEVDSTVRGLRGERFDVALDFQGNFKSGVLAALSGAPRRIGAAQAHTREFNWAFINERVSLDGGAIPRFERATRLANVLAPSLKPRLPALEAQSTVAGELLSNLVPCGKPLIGIHPGASKFGAFKRWPALRFGELARMLRERLDARVLVTWGKAERALAEEVAAASGGAAELAPAASDLGTLVELLRRFDLFIAGDTGPLHIAAVAGVPVVAIFGPKDPAIYRPYGDEQIVVREEVPCSPCTKRRCGDMICLTRLQPEKVYAAAERRLGRSGRSPG